MPEPETCVQEPRTSSTSLQEPRTSETLAVRPPEAARMLSLSVRTVKGLILRGEIPVARVSPNVTLIPVDAIRQWLEAQVAKVGR